MKRHVGTLTKKEEEEEEEEKPMPQKYDFSRIYFTRQAVSLIGNTEVSTYNRCCSRKSIGITYSKCVCL
jgi:hypothetical protein